MRENVEGKVECVCAHVSVFARAAVHVTWQGDSIQRAAGTDVWLPLTAHPRRGWSAEGPTPGPPFPPDKSQRPFDRCEFSGFCAQSLETCRVRNLTFAESQSAFSIPCRRQRRVNKRQAKKGGRRCEGVQVVGGRVEQRGGPPSSAPASFDTTN